MLILLILYYALAVLLTVYGLNCHVLIHLFARSAADSLHGDESYLQGFYAGDGGRDSLPVVTTQLPIYNEMNVAERVIRAVAAFDYPAGKHQIQVLDDSTDETVSLVASVVADIAAQGVDISHIRRTDRQGFKAGALRQGLATARGDYLAIFDADFAPPPDFLLRAMPFFQEQSGIGLVQARWEHLNPGQNLITRLQAMGIDGHFTIEQSARSASGLFMNFNGTAGVFTRQAILDAGNWQDDTLTEDMDLSYRMQLAGWKCRYVLGLAAPAEIPADIAAFKSQQFRWAKGSIQTAKKLLPRILGSDRPWFHKIQAALHLTHYAIHPMMLALSLLALPILLYTERFLPPMFFGLFGVLLALSCTGPSRLYLASQRVLGRRIRVLAMLPLMVCLGCGLAVNNSRAVLEGALSIRSGFIRTPKQGFATRKQYRVWPGMSWLAELAAGLWCACGVYAYFKAGQYLVGPFMLVYSLGFLGVSFLTLGQSLGLPLLPDHGQAAG